MMTFLIRVLSLSEIWAMLIPLSVVIFKKQPKYLSWVEVYVVVGLLINIIADIGFVLGKKAPAWAYPNIYLYHISSIFRFICFASFFISLDQPFLKTIKKVVLVVGLIVFVLIFQVDNFYDEKSISSRLFATEAAFLLFYCLQYYLYKMQQDTVSQRTPDYWVVVGLSIYVVINFVFFLLYRSLMEKGYDKTLANFWHFHNLTFVIFCIFIAKAFHASNKH